MNNIPRIVNEHIIHIQMYLQTNYVIKFVGDLHGFFSGTPVSSTNKTDRQVITAILLKVEFNTITPQTN